MCAVFGPFRSGPGIALSSYWNAGTMPEKDFYLLIAALSIVAGLWLIQIITERIGRRRDRSRLERAIAEYLRSKALGKQ